MSLDKSSGSGDQHPDKTPGPEHRPFPRAPEDRPVPAGPTGYRSFEEIAAERAARVAGRGPGEQDAGKDTAGPRSGPAGAGAGTADANLRGAAGAPGSRERTGAAPGNAPPGRGEGSGPQYPVPRGQDPGRPDAPPGRRPDVIGDADRPRLRPFPGQPDNRPFAPPPTGYRSFEEIRAERAARAADSGTADRGPARAAERTAPGQATAKDAERTAKDAPEPKSDPGTPAERAAGPREQGRGGSEQAASRQAQDGTGTSERPRAEATPARMEIPGNPGADPPSADVQHHPGQAPAADAHRPGDKAVITYAHAEFHGQKFGAYTDGTHWVSEEAVRAMARKNEQSKAPERHGITDFPQQRNLGDNTVGENPDVHLGDTSDLRTFADKMRGEAPFGQNLDETDSPSESRMGRLLDGIMDHPDDFHDVTGSNTESVADFFLSGPGPTGMHTLQSSRPEFDPAPSHGLNAGDAVGNSILVVAAVATGLRRLAESHRRDH